MSKIWITWFNYTKRYIKQVYGEEAWEEIMWRCGDPLADIHFAKLRGEKEELRDEIWITWFNYTKRYIKQVYGEEAWEEIMWRCGDPLADIHFAKLRGEKEEYEAEEFGAEESINPKDYIGIIFLDQHGNGHTSTLLNTYDLRFGERGSTYFKALREALDEGVKRGDYEGYKIKKETPIPLQDEDYVYERRYNDEYEYVVRLMGDKFFYGDSDIPIVKNKYTINEGEPKFADMVILNVIPKEKTELMDGLGSLFGAERYEPTPKEIRFLVRNLRAVWIKYERGIYDEDDVIQKMERILYHTGVMQEEYEAEEFGAEGERTFTVSKGPKRMYIVVEYNDGKELFLDGDGQKQFMEELAEAEATGDEILVEKIFGVGSDYHGIAEEVVEAEEFGVESWYDIPESNKMHQLNLDGAELLVLREAITNAYHPRKYEPFDEEETRMLKRMKDKIHKKLGLNQWLRHLSDKEVEDLGAEEFEAEFKGREGVWLYRYPLSYRPNEQGITVFKDKEDWLPIWEKLCEDYIQMRNREGLEVFERQMQEKREDFPHLSDEELEEQFPTSFAYWKRQTIQIPQAIDDMVVRFNQQGDENGVYGIDFGNKRYNPSGNHINNAHTITYRDYHAFVFYPFGDNEYYEAEEFEATKNCVWCGSTENICCTNEASQNSVKGIKNRFGEEVIESFPMSNPTEEEYVCDECCFICGDKSVLIPNLIESSEMGHPESFEATKGIDTYAQPFEELRIKPSKAKVGILLASIVAGGLLYANKMKED